MKESVSVIIPAFNEEKDIKNVIEKAKKCEYVGEILVVDNLSTDKTSEKALEAGAKVIKCKTQGKGAAMKKGLENSTKNIVVFLDADISDYVDNIVYKLINPIMEKKVDFTKSTFYREGGRVTELVAKPMLKLLFPDLEKYSQPLSGMIAGKKEIFEKIELEDDYGVDIGILIDLVNMGCNIEEVSLGTVENDSKDWKELKQMSEEVMSAILNRRFK